MCTFQEFLVLLHSCAITSQSNFRTQHVILNIPHVQESCSFNVSLHFQVWWYTEYIGNHWWRNWTKTLHWALAGTTIYGLALGTPLLFFHLSVCTWEASAWLISTWKVFDRQCSKQRQKWEREWMRRRTNWSPWANSLKIVSFQALKFRESTIKGQNPF